MTSSVPYNKFMSVQILFANAIILILHATLLRDKILFGFLIPKEKQVHDFRGTSIHSCQNKKKF